jgi:beta-lactamase class D
VYELSGKTGAGRVGGLNLGWFVGYVKENGKVYFFAANIEGSSSAANGVRAKAITQDLLRGLQLLP